MKPEQFRWWLAKNEPDMSVQFDADFPDDDFCWEDVARWLPPNANHDKFVAWLIRRGEPKDLIDFAKYIVIRDDIRDALICCGGGADLNEWLYAVREDKQVLDALVEKGRPQDWYYYLRDISDDKQVLDALIGSKDAEMLKEFLLNVDSKNQEVRQALIQTGDASICADMMFEILHQNWEFFKVVSGSAHDREWLAGRLEAAAAELRQDNGK